MTCYSTLLWHFTHPNALHKSYPPASILLGEVARAVAPHPLLQPCSSDGTAAKTGPLRSRFTRLDRTLGASAPQATTSGPSHLLPEPTPAVIGWSWTTAHLIGPLAQQRSKPDENRASQNGHAFVTRRFICNVDINIFYLYSSIFIDINWCNTWNTRRVQCCYLYKWGFYKGNKIKTRRLLHYFHETHMKIIDQI